MKTATGSPALALLFFTVKWNQLCQLLFVSHVLQQSDHLSDAPPDSVPFVDVSLVLGAQNWAQYSTRDLKNAEWIVITSLKPLLILLQMQPSVQLSLHLYKSSWIIFNLLPTRTHRSFFAKLLSRQSVPSLYLHMFQVQDFMFLHLLNFMRLLLGHSSSLLRFLWMVALDSIILMISPRLVSTADLVSVQSILSLGSLMKINSIGLTINPRGVP